MCMRINFVLRSGLNLCMNWVRSRGWVRLRPAYVCTHCYCRYKKIYIHHWSGYLYDFNMYTVSVGDTETALSKKFVFTLTNSIKGRHHQVLFTTTVNHVNKLLAQNMYACGSIG